MTLIDEWSPHHSHWHWQWCKCCWLLEWSLAVVAGGIRKNTWAACSLLFAPVVCCICKARTFRMNPPRALVRLIADAPTRDVWQIHRAKVLWIIRTWVVFVYLPRPMEGMGWLQFFFFTELPVPPKMASDVGPGLGCMWFVSRKGRGICGACTGFLVVPIMPESTWSLQGSSVHKTRHCPIVGTSEGTYSDIYTSIYLSIYLYIYIYIYIYISISIYLYIYISIYLYIYISIYLYIYISIYLYLYIYIEREMNIPPD